MWVFGYGSLIWHPGFPVAETRLARASGWHRSFCMWSIHYRGTVATPGLVLALDRAPGSTCDGVAFRVAPGAEQDTLANLRDRELISSAYLETTLPLQTTDGPIDALAYVIDPGRRTILRRPDAGTAGADHRGGLWERGPNCDYLWNTADHLAALGIGDNDLEWLSRRVRALLSQA